MNVRPDVDRRIERHGADHVPTVRRQDPVSTALRARCTLLDPDYFDAFSMAGGLADTSPERWARAMFDVVGGHGAQLVWRGCLGMRLRAAPDRIAGWAIGDRGVDWIRLDASSRSMTGQLLVQATADHVSFATFIRYDRWWARCIWRPLSAAHRRLSPGLLTDAYRLLQTLD